MTGTIMILLVLAKKSAEASMTSMAIFRDLKKQHTHYKYTTPRMPVKIPMKRSSFMASLSSSVVSSLDLISLYLVRVKPLAVKSPIWTRTRIIQEKVSAKKLIK